MSGLQRRQPVRREAERLGLRGEAVELFFDLVPLGQEGAVIGVEILRLVAAEKRVLPFLNLCLEGHLRDARGVGHLGEPVDARAIGGHRLVEPVHAVESDHDDCDKHDGNDGRQR